MSGGVDSSVAAAMMLHEGYSVIGVTFKMFDSDETNAAISDASCVAELLGIQHFVINIENEFKHYVVDYYQKTYLSGETPSPCIMCNQFVKMNLLYQFAQQHDCQKIATGHYARISVENERISLSCAKDTSKDQSYFLYRVSHDILSKCLFPLGNYLKNADTRAFAKKIGIPVAEKRDSQDVCFAKTKWYHDFFSRHNPGDIVDENGQVLGQHKGVIHYTKGQRKGLGLSSGPFFVKDIVSNQLIVSKEKPVSNLVNLADTVWINEPFIGQCRAKVRSQNAPINCSVTSYSSGSATIGLNIPDCLSPGQHCVMYDLFNNVIGGGIINKKKYTL